MPEVPLGVKLPPRDVYIAAAMKRFHAFTRVGPVSMTAAEYEQLCNDQYQVLSKLTPAQLQAHAEETWRDRQPMEKAILGQVEETLQAVKSGRIGEHIDKLKRHKEGIDTKTDEIVRAQQRREQGPPLRIGGGRGIESKSRRGRRGRK